MPTELVGVAELQQQHLRQHREKEEPQQHQHQHLRQHREKEEPQQQQEQEQHLRQHREKEEPQQQQEQEQHLRQHREKEEPQQQQEQEQHLRQHREKEETQQEQEQEQQQQETKPSATTTVAPERTATPVRSSPSTPKTKNDDDDDNSCCLTCCCSTNNNTSTRSHNTNDETNYWEWLFDLALSDVVADDDSFITTIRKVILTFYGIATITVVGVPYYGYQASQLDAGHSQNLDIALTCVWGLLALGMCLPSFLYMRYTKTATDALMLYALISAMLLTWTIDFLCTHFPVRSTNIALATMTVAANPPGKGYIVFFVWIHYILVEIRDAFEIHIRVPDPHQSAPVEKFLFSFIGMLAVFLMPALIAAAILESQRLLSSAKDSVNLAKSVARKLVCYDVDGIKDLLKQCGGSSSKKSTGSSNNEEEEYDQQEGEEEEEEEEEQGQDVEEQEKEEDKKKQEQQKSNNNSEKKEKSNNSYDQMMTPGFEQSGSGSDATNNNSNNSASGGGGNSGVRKVENNSPLFSENLDGLTRSQDLLEGEEQSKTKTNKKQQKEKKKSEKHKKKIKVNEEQKEEEEEKKKKQQNKKTKLYSEFDEMREIFLRIADNLSRYRCHLPNWVLPSQKELEWWRARFQRQDDLTRLRKVREEGGGGAGDDNNNNNQLGVSFNTNNNNYRISDSLGDSDLQHMFNLEFSAAAREAALVGDDSAFFDSTHFRSGSTLPLENSGAARSPRGLSASDGEEALGEQEEGEDAEFAVMTIDRNKQNPRQQQQEQQTQRTSNAAPTAAAAGDGVGGSNQHVVVVVPDSAAAAGGGGGGSADGRRVPSTTSSTPTTTSLDVLATALKRKSVHFFSTMSPSKELRGSIVQRVIFAKINLKALTSRCLPSFSNGLFTANEATTFINSFVDGLLESAATHEASIHSIVADSIILSFNATKRSFSNESKALKFLVNLKSLTKKTVSAALSPLLRSSSLSSTSSSNTSTAANSGAVTTPIHSSSSSPAAAALSVQTSKPQQQHQQEERIPSHPPPPFASSHQRRSSAESAGGTDDGLQQRCSHEIFELIHECENLISAAAVVGNSFCQVAGGSRRQYFFSSGFSNQHILDDCSRLSEYQGNFIVDRHLHARAWRYDVQTRGCGIVPLRAPPDLFDLDGSEEKKRRERRRGSSERRGSTESGGSNNNTKKNSSNKNRNEMKKKKLTSLAETALQDRHYHLRFIDLVSQLIKYENIFPGRVLQEQEEEEMFLQQVKKGARGELLIDWDAASNVSLLESVDEGGYYVRDPAFYSDEDVNKNNSQQQQQQQQQQHHHQKRINDNNRRVSLLNPAATAAAAEQYGYHEDSASQSTIGGAFREYLLRNRTGEESSGLFPIPGFVEGEGEQEEEHEGEEKKKKQQAKQQQQQQQRVHTPFEFSLLDSQNMLGGCSTSSSSDEDREDILPTPVTTNSSKQQQQQQQRKQQQEGENNNNNNNNDESQEEVGKLLLTGSTLTVHSVHSSKFASQNRFRNNNNNNNNSSAFFFAPAFEIVFPSSSSSSSSSTKEQQQQQQDATPNSTPSSTLSPGSAASLAPVAMRKEEDQWMQQNQAAAADDYRKRKRKFFEKGDVSVFTKEERLNELLTQAVISISKGKFEKASKFLETIHQEEEKEKGVGEEEEENEQERKEEKRKKMSAAVDENIATQLRQQEKELTTTTSDNNNNNSKKTTAGEKKEKGEERNKPAVETFKKKEKFTKSKTFLCVERALKLCCI